MFVCRRAGGSGFMHPLWFEVRLPCLESGRASGIANGFRNSLKSCVPAGAKLSLIELSRLALRTLFVDVAVLGSNEIYRSSSESQRSSRSSDRFACACSHRDYAPFARECAHICVHSSRSACLQANTAQTVQHGFIIRSTTKLTKCP